MARKTKVTPQKEELPEKEQEWAKSEPKLSQVNLLSQV
jgi:hypothetical protein